MPTYPTYKLGDICETTSGGTPNRKNDAYYGGIIPWVKSGELGKGVIYDTEEKITEKAVKESSAKVFPEGTLLIALYGATIGKLGFLGVPAATNQAVCGIFANEKIDLQFLSYYLFHKRNDLIAQGTGGAQPNISQTILKNLPIPLPPLPTQHQIVARIEALFAELDKAAEHLRTAQQQLKTYRQAVLNHWLNNDDGKWEMVPIKEIISVISNGSTPKADKMFSKGEIQFLKVYNLNFDGSINLSKEPVFIERDTHETLLKRSQTKQGDVLINIVGPPLGKVSIIPEGEKEYNINQAIVMFRPNEFVTSKFLAYYLMSPQVIAWLTSTSKATAGQYNVKVSTCREIMFPKISISDQHRIVQEIESRLSQAEAAEASIAEALQKTEALRQSILKKAFSGELVPGSFI